VRFEQLTLRIPGDEFRVPFHERLTVLAGIGVLERRAMIDSIVGALAGGPQSTELVYRDAQGRTVTVTCEAGRVSSSHDDGSPAIDLLQALRLDAGSLTSLLLLGPADLGLLGSGVNEPPELAETRATLSAMTEQVQAALAAKQAADALRDELATIEERIRVSEENQARREYARVLSELEKVRSEAAAIRSGRTGADADRHLLASAEGARDLAAVWREAATEAAELIANFGDHDRLDARAVEEALAIPDDAPTELVRLLEAMESTESEREELSGRLRAIAASRLPEPSSPLVVDLARIDQAVLWEANKKALESAATLNEVSIALGGLPAGDQQTEPGVADEIERWHDAVLEAEALVGRTRKPGLAATTAGVLVGATCTLVVPLVAPAGLVGAAFATAWLLVRPKRKLAKAEDRERSALKGAGASSYLAFHLRRVDAVLDPDARERLELAALEHRMAMARWHEVAGDLDPDQTAALRAEVEAYASSLANLGGAADEIEHLRTELSLRVEPAAEKARLALLDAIAPYGIEEPSIAAKLISHQVQLGRLARLQRRLESAESTERSARAKLDGMLADRGFAEGDLAARVGAFEWACERAAEREEARQRAREIGEVETDLARLEDQARRLRRPEWASVTPAEANGPDLDELKRRREGTASAYEAACAVQPDVDRMVDRHAALERRVAVLEAGLGAAAASGIDVDDVRQYLLASLTGATHAGPHGDPMPVLVDEAFARMQPDSKWELLDLLERLAEKAQVIYLTDDPYVAGWARRRAAAGAITLLEPVADNS